MAMPPPLPGESSIETVSLTTPEESPSTKATREKNEKVLALARQRFHVCQSAYAHFREQAKDDIRFRAGTWGDRSFQWNEGIQEKRRATDCPCLTINRAPGFVRQVTNQARQAHLRIIVSPVDDQGDVKTAEVLQGIIHNIESTSFADRAYALASEKQAEIGLGFFRLITEYADEKGFSQRIKIKREADPLSIYIDPAALEADTSDAEYAFKVTAVDAEAWKELTGQDTAPSAASLAGYDDADKSDVWFPNGKILYLEYFSRENNGPRQQLAQLSDGTVVPAPSPTEEQALHDIGVRVMKTRWVQPKHMVWRKIDALHIHEETIWKADSHPFIPVMGDELAVDGEKDYRGVIRDSKESARIYNVEVSALVEAVGLGQKAPIVGYRGQFGAPDSKMRRAWETANVQPHAFLEVEPMDIDGKPAPIPQRVPMETNLQGIVVAIHQSDEDYKTTAGFRDASLGERGPQESGKAILARQKQDELGSSHYLDNLRFSLCSGGRQLIQLIRVVYDEPTVVRIKGKDEKSKKVLVFAGAEKDPRRPEFLPRDQITGQPMPFQLPEGVTELYDLSVGEFDVEVSAMPSSGTRRQEAVEAMTSLFKEMPPELSSKFLDLYFKTMDFPGASQLMERAKKVLPPEFRDDEEGQPSIPPEAQKQMAEMKDHLDKLEAAYKGAVQEIETEKTKQQGLRQIQMDALQSKERMQAEELAAAERLAQLKQRADLIEQQIALKAEHAQTILEAELDRMAQAADHAQQARIAARQSQDKASDHAATGRRQVLDLTHDVLAQRAEQAKADADAAAGEAQP